MTDKEKIKNELLQLMIRNAEESKIYWRKGDVKTVKEIVGSEGWSRIAAAGLPHWAGQQFSVIAKDLDLLKVGKASNRILLYKRKEHDI